MPRPVKCRRVCFMPRYGAFGPISDGSGVGEAITLTVDEYETIRLIDKVGMSQEECGECMNVSRATVQQIYMNARKKISDSIVDGAVLKIEGGEYVLCDRRTGQCGYGGFCRNHRRGRFAANITETKGEEK